MQTNFHRPISHTEVAQEARMSSSYFARCFKEYYQLSPIRFLMQLRMEKAKTELTLTELPVKAVAACASVFQSMHHFSRTRAFTRHVRDPFAGRVSRRARARVKKSKECTAPAKLKNRGQRRRRAGRCNF